MKFIENIQKIFISSLFIVLMVFPSVVQFSHIFEGHEHVACKEVKTHIHQKTTDCQIDSFHFDTFEYAFTNYSEIEHIPQPSVRVSLASSQLISSFKQSTTQLRAPPVLTFS